MADHHAIFIQHPAYIPIQHFQFQFKQPIYVWVQHQCLRRAHTHMCTCFLGRLICDDHAILMGRGGMQEVSITLTSGCGIACCPCTAYAWNKREHTFMPHDLVGVRSLWTPYRCCRAGLGLMFTMLCPKSPHSFEMSLGPSGKLWKGMKRGSSEIGMI